jgi:hypothetical protein
VRLSAQKNEASDSLEAHFDNVVLMGGQVFADSFEACTPDVEGFPDADMDGFGDYLSPPFLFCGSLHYGYVGNALDCNDASGDIFPGQTELCDGVDNNCEDGIDEGNPGGGEYCPTGQVGVCEAGTTNCAAGQLLCVQNEPPTEEICDGLDNDCDGATDEGNPGGGGYCPTGQPGVCEAGTSVCEGGGLVCAQNEPPTEEVCDGLDNDCDGATDEGNPGGGGYCDTGNFGICAAGTAICEFGVLDCIADNMPDVEVCDGLDNDCDGETDEGNPGGGSYCLTGLPGVCESGTENCIGGGLVCVEDTPASPEVCDGMDNDCDGETDEGNPGGGGPCETGQPGICAAGTLSCAAGVLDCVPNETPIREICGDSLDNDCDGEVDEGCP